MMIGTYVRVFLISVLASLTPALAAAQGSLERCPENDAEWDNCFGKWSDGKGYTYEGEWRENKEDGTGVANYANGDTYAGEFRAGEYNGQGTYTYADGSEYAGEFADNASNGQFTVRYANGDSFAGGYQSDRREGQGTYIWEDGSQFAGQWKDGLPTTDGTHTTPDGTVLIGVKYEMAKAYSADGDMSEPDLLTFNGGEAIERESSDVTSGAQPSSPDSGSLKKVAIVLGNGAYENANPLRNPRNDAQAMSEMLTDLGFTVFTAVDANKSEMEESIRHFLKEVRSADVSVFFYSGHGMEVGGENFLIPVDTELKDESSLNFEVINARVVTDAMGGDRKVGIILLDACRNNPFTKSLKRSMAASRAASISDGLAPISTEGGGLVVAFATAPGDTAADGEGVNSPFTTALLKWMPQKGLEIEQVLKRVKSEVSAITGNDQRPWTNSDLTMDVYIAGK